MKKVRVRIPLIKYPLAIIYYFAGLLFYQDRRITKRLYDYFPTYRSLVGEFLNQFYRCLGSPRSFLPQGIVIEPTNYCNLRCAHCTAQAVDERKGYMDYEFYKHILDDNPQLTCLILTTNGEPLLNPRICDMIAYAKSKGIYVSMYTNGILLNRKMADRISDTGLDEINFSLESTGEEYEKNRHVQYGALKQNIEYMIDKKKLMRSDLKIGLNVARTGDDDSSIRMVRNEWEGKVDHIDVEPLMGKRSFPRKTSCRTLWRNAVVKWDGVVLPCCIDMCSTLAMGDLKKNTLKEIFNNAKAIAIRKSHLDRKYPAVCAYCDILFG